MNNVELSAYKKFYIWFGKKVSLIKAKRNANTDYLAVENGLFTIIMDGIMISLALSYFFPISFSTFISLASASFILKRVFPSVIQFISSINLIKVGK